MNRKMITRVPVNVEYTDGYQERFTHLILKMYEKRISKQNNEELKKEEKMEESSHNL